MAVVAVLSGLVAGGGIVWYLLQRTIADLGDRTRILDGELAAARAELDEVRNRCIAAETKAERVPRLEADLAASSEERTALKEKVGRLESTLEAQEAAFEVARESLNETFQATASQVLKGTQESFFEAAKDKLEGIAKLSEKDLKERQAAIDGLLKPVDEKLKSLDEQIRAVEKARAGAYEGLTKQVESLMSAHQEMRKETATLTQALKGSAQRGRWGEIQLRRLVEISEMTAHCDFIEQASVEGKDGRIRPDLIIRLPNKNTVIVDSKAPYNMWSEAEEAPDHEARQAKMKEFAKQVRQAVTSLGGKAYQTQVESVDFVVMFLPGEHYLADALRADPDLIDYGFERRVLLATPTTLLGLLRTIHMGWQNAKLADTAKEIAAEGRMLHKHIRIFAEHFETVRRHFKKADEAMEATEKTAYKGITSAAKRLERLGAKSEKALPERVIAEIEDDVMEVAVSDEPHAIEVTARPRKRAKASKAAPAASAVIFDLFEEGA